MWKERKDSNIKKCRMRKWTRTGDLMNFVLNFNHTCIGDHELCYSIVYFIEFYHEKNFSLQNYYSSLKMFDINAHDLFHLF